MFQKYALAFMAFAGLHASSTEAKSIHNAECYSQAFSRFEVSVFAISPLPTPTSRSMHPDPVLYRREEATNTREFFQAREEWRREHENLVKSGTCKFVKYKQVQNKPRGLYRAKYLKGL